MIEVRPPELLDYSTMVRPANDPQVADLVRRLRSAFDPCTIWLFGSRAQGNPREDSDYDVMVVVASSDENQFARHSRGQSVLAGFPAAVDLIVYTEQEWRELAPKRYSVARQVRESGIILHAA